MASEDREDKARGRGRPSRHEPRLTNFDRLCDRLRASPRSWFCAQCAGGEASIGRNTVLMLFLRLDAAAAFRRVNGACSKCGRRRIVATFIGSALD